MIDATPLAALHEQVGNFLDEQRHAPSTLSHPVNHFFRQRILGGKHWADPTTLDVWRGITEPRADSAETAGAFSWLGRA